MNYLIGAGGHGLVVLDVLLNQGIHIDAFIDSTPKPDKIRGISCHQQGPTTINDTDQILISIGSNAIRKKLAALHAGHFLTAIHPSAIIDETAIIHEGSVVMATAVINARANIGRHVIINTGAVVEHECVIGDYAHISPNATLCGNVHVGEGSQVGAGAVVIPNIKIGRGCMIGAGSVVIRDIPDNTLVFGNPARAVRELPDF
jgi:sugar O-acyltransferase (sialic acid O-acetyltransferase NeuD family)